jgi:hypothetical protein
MTLFYATPADSSIAVPKDDDLIYRVPTDRARAARLVADLAAMPEPPRVAGVITKWSLVLYVWRTTMRLQTDVIYRLTEEHYLGLVSADTITIPRGAAWATGQALVKLLGGSDA